MKKSARSASLDVAKARRKAQLVTDPIEVWIDETERRRGFLFEASRPGDSTGH